MIEEKNKKLVEQSQENISETDVKKEESQIKEVNQQEVERILNAINGIAVKFGDCVFKINYINIGKNRFSAECINIKKV